MAGLFEEVSQQSRDFLEELSLLVKHFSTILEKTFRKKGVKKNHVPSLLLVEFSLYSQFSPYIFLPSFIDPIFLHFHLTPLSTFPTAFFVKHTNIIISSPFPHNFYRPICSPFEKYTHLLSTVGDANPVADHS